MEQVKAETPHTEEDLGDTAPARDAADLAMAKAMREETLAKLQGNKPQQATRGTTGGQRRHPGRTQEATGRGTGVDRRQQDAQQASQEGITGWLPRHM